jgi:hypothetical protein
MTGGGEEQSCFLLSAVEDFFVTGCVIRLILEFVILVSAAAFLARPMVSAIIPASPPSCMDSTVELGTITMVAFFSNPHKACRPGLSATLKCHTPSAPLCIGMALRSQLLKSPANDTCQAAGLGMRTESDSVWSLCYSIKSYSCFLFLLWMGL